MCGDDGRQVQGVPELNDFEGKVALVTGGTSGIGKATASKFRAAGARVVITGRSPGQGRSAAEEIGGGVVYAQGDMTDADDVRRCAEVAEREFGGLDFVVHCAARSQAVEIVDMPDEEFDEVVRSVLHSTFLVTKYSVPALEARGGGAIVNVGSAVGERPTKRLCAYAAAKAGVMNFTRCSALELRDKAIRVNLVSPGWTYTPIIETVRTGLEEVHGEELEGLVARLQGRWGTPGEMADAIAYLCSDEAAFISGTILSVDNTLGAGLKP